MIYYCRNKKNNQKNNKKTTSFSSTFYRQQQQQRQQYFLLLLLIGLLLVNICYGQQQQQNNELPTLVNCIRLMKDYDDDNNNGLNFQEYLLFLQSLSPCSLTEDAFENTIPHFQKISCTCQQYITNRANAPQCICGTTDLEVIALSSIALPGIYPGAYIVNICDELTAFLYNECPTTTRPINTISTNTPSPVIINTEETSTTDAPILEIIPAPGQVIVPPVDDNYTNNDTTVNNGDGGIVDTREAPSVAAEKDGNDDGPNKLAIIIPLFVLVLLAIIVGVMLIIKRRRNHQHRNFAPVNSVETGSDMGDTHRISNKKKNENLKDNEDDDHGADETYAIDEDYYNIDSDVKEKIANDIEAALNSGNSIGKQQQNKFNNKSNNDGKGQEEEEEEGQEVVYNNKVNIEPNLQQITCNSSTSKNDDIKIIMEKKNNMAKNSKTSSSSSSFMMALDELKKEYEISTTTSPQISFIVESANTTSAASGGVGSGSETGVDHGDHTESSNSSSLGLFHDYEDDSTSNYESSNGLVPLERTSSLNTNNNNNNSFRDWEWKDDKIDSRIDDVATMSTTTTDKKRFVVSRE